jgi:hypothetical protein
MTNDLLIYGQNICAFPHILGSPSSYMTLHPIPSEFPYIWGTFCFVSYQCTRDFCPALAPQVGPIQNIFVFALYYFNAFVLTARQAGQAAVLRRLALSMCLWDRTWIFRHCAFQCNFSHRITRFPFKVQYYFILLYVYCTVLISN